MVINKVQLYKFLKILSLKGNVINKEALFNITSKKLESIIVHYSKIVALKGVLKGEFEHIGEIGVDNLQFLTKSVGSFKSDINITKKDNKLILKDNTLKISCILKNIGFIENKIDVNKFNGLLNTNIPSIKLTNKQTKQLINYYNIINSDDIILTNQDGKLAILSEKNENQLVGVVDVDIGNEFKVKLPSIFIEVLSLLEDPIQLRLTNDNPVYIGIDNDNYTFDILIQRKV